MDWNVRTKPVKPRARQVRAPWGALYWTVYCRQFFGRGDSISQALADWRMRAKVAA